MQIQRVKNSTFWCRSSLNVFIYVFCFASTLFCQILDMHMQAQVWWSALAVLQAGTRRLAPALRGDAGNGKGPGRWKSCCLHAKTIWRRSTAAFKLLAANGWFSISCNTSSKQNLRLCWWTKQCQGMGTGTGHKTLVWFWCGMSNPRTWLGLWHGWIHGRNEQDQDPFRRGKLNSATQIW